MINILILCFCASIITCGLECDQIWEMISHLYCVLFSHPDLAGRNEPSERVKTASSYFIYVGVIQPGRENVMGLYVGVYYIAHERTMCYIT